MKKIKNNKFFIGIVFVVVLLIPLIYSFFYLKSYWNPYGNLSDMKIAVINSDKGKDEKNQGNEFVQSLKDSATFNIQEVNKDEAEKGMEKGEYYATIEIPENFTECLESASATDKQIAQITYSPNQATNYLATQIVNSAVKTIELNLQAKVDKEIIAILANKLNEVPNNLQTISDGAGTILDGTNSLNNGIKQLDDGTTQLSNSYSEFNNGVESAYTGSKSLNNGVSQVSEGINTLKDGSKNLDNAIEQINAGTDQLNSQGNEGITKLTDGINKLNVGAQKVNSGVTEYTTGTNNLAIGSKKYVTGTGKLIKNVNNYFTNVDNMGKQASTMVTKLQEIAKKYPEDADLQKLAKQASGLNQGFAGLNQGAEEIKKGEEDLQSNDQTINAGADKLINSTKELQEGSNSLYEGTKNLAEGTTDLGKLTQGMSSLKTALTQVKQGTTSLNKGIETLSTGTNSLQTGSNTLTSGLKTLSSSSNKIDNAINTLSEGTSSAYVGSNKLADGAKTFKTAIDGGLQNTKEQLKSLEGIAEFGENPVEIKTEEYGKVDSYGIAFTPLFLCIGLWVGALMCYVVLYYDHDDRFGIFGTKTKNKLLQNLIYIGIGAFEGLITGMLLKAGLGYDVQNIGLYYFTSILIGITFMSIIQFLIRNFGDIGKFLALIILVLQLAAAGGTFPIETIDKGFQAISPYLPMTYSIKLLREILVPTASNYKMNYILILLGISIVTFAITTVVDIVKNKKEA